MASKRVSEKKQEAILDELAKSSALSLIVFLGQNIDKLVELAKDRALNIGRAQYGDAAYTYSDKKLKKEAMEELADAIFYLHIPLARAKGLIE